MINCIGQLTDIKRMFSATVGETFAQVLEVYKRRLSNE
ncbi:hypothetical protein J2T13_000161 [Paenibacillus sp. DS2015]